MAAALQQLGGSPERVLNALLEGALPPALEGVDRQLGLPAWQAASSANDSKGKQPAAPTYDSEFPAALPGAGASAGSSTAAALARAARAEGKTAK